MDERFKRPYSNPRFWWDGDYLPICFDCAYFQGAYKGRPRCEAFPDGIPKELFKRDAKHNVPYPGDSGIQYKKYTG